MILPPATVGKFSCKFLGSGGDGGRKRAPACLRADARGSLRSLRLLGRVTIGYYKLEGDMLTMTDGSGVPIRRRSGDVVRQKLQPGDDAVLISKRLTLSIYRMAQGDGVAGFNRPLNYPRVGIA
jgi:hypothetical protein